MNWNKLTWSLVYSFLCLQNFSRFQWVSHQDQLKFCRDTKKEIHKTSGQFISIYFSLFSWNSGPYFTPPQSHTNPYVAPHCLGFLWFELCYLTQPLILIMSVPILVELRMGKTLYQNSTWHVNRSFLSCLSPLLQSESWCEAFHMEISFIHM